MFMQQKAYIAALEWYIDQGVDEALLDLSLDRRQKAEPFQVLTEESDKALLSSASPAVSHTPAAPLGQSEALQQSIKIAKEANTLDELRAAIAAFDGISLKKTATNMVFSDGNPNADVMLIGEAPGADEDRQGKPFVGETGQLLDRILSSIGLSREAEEPEKAVYISNILNWRPPGNRTPSPAEIAVSLPFIERHIELVQPKMIILCGAVSAKALLCKEQGISRMRKILHNYLPFSDEVRDNEEGIGAIATYHPAYLLRNPGQKAAVWHDMCTVKQALQNMQNT